MRMAFDNSKFRAAGWQADGGRQHVKPGNYSFRVVFTRMTSQSDSGDVSS
jgi:hypothetical protein